MKKILYIALLFGVICFTSCDKDHGTLYKSGDRVDASFPSSVLKISMLSSDNNKISIPLWRGNTKGAVSVPVTITNEAGSMFTASKSSFDFADGQAEAYIDFTYSDINNFGGETHEITMELSDKDMASYGGFSSIDIKAQRQLTMKLIGTGEYYSDWYEESWPQKVYKAEEADYYELPDCYVSDYTLSFSIINGKPKWQKGQNTGYYSNGRGSYLYLDVQESYITGQTITAMVYYQFYDAGSFYPDICPERFTFPADYVIPK